MLRNDSQELLKSSPKSKTSYGTLEIYKRQATLDVRKIRQNLSRVNDRQKHESAIKWSWGLIISAGVIGLWTTYIAIVVILAKYYLGNRFLPDYEQTKEHGTYCKDAAPLSNVCDWPDTYNKTLYQICFDRAAKLCTAKNNAWFDDTAGTYEFNFLMSALIIGVVLLFATVFSIPGIFKYIKAPNIDALPELEKANVREILPELQDGSTLDEIKSGLTDKMNEADKKAARVLSFFNTDAETPIQNFIERDTNLDCTNHIIKHAGLTG